MPRSVVDDVFSRVRPYPTAAPSVTRARSRTNAEPTPAPAPAPPRDDFSLLTVDGLAEVMGRVLDLANEPAETPQPMLDTARIAFMQRICNTLQTIRLVNSTLNSPAILQKTFERIAEKMTIDPVEVAHRDGELNGNFLMRIKALMLERCKFLSMLARRDERQNAKAVKNAARNALTTTVVLSGTKDLHATNEERLARCLWYSAWTTDATSLMAAIHSLIIKGWSTHVLTLASFLPTTLPKNSLLRNDEKVLAVIGDAFEVEAVVKEAQDGENTITVEYINASHQKETRVVARAAVRYPPTVTCTALEHLLTRYLRSYVQQLTELNYQELITVAGWMNNALATRILIQNRMHILNQDMLEAGLFNAVKKENVEMFVAVAHRGALKEAMWTGAPTYLTEENMAKAHSAVERPEQTELLYLPGAPETPNYFFRDDATAEQLAEWKAAWNQRTTSSRVSYLRNHVVLPEKIHNNTVDLTLVEAWANVPGHPLRAFDVIWLIEKLSACHQTNPRDGAWIALARRLYEQVPDDDDKRLAQDGFPAAQLGQPVK